MIVTKPAIQRPHSLILLGFASVPLASSLITLQKNVSHVMRHVQYARIKPINVLFAVLVISVCTKISASKCALVAMLEMQNQAYAFMLHQL